MEAFFDRGGPWGRQMMCSSASVQVCVDAGDDSDGTSGFRWRWRLAHAIGPVLVAAFANSPLRSGTRTGWRSTRQQIWSHLDSGRTRPPMAEVAAGPPAAGPAVGPDPRDAWAAYALDASVICIPGAESASADWTAPEGLTFRRWLTSGSPRPVRDGDLDYHLTTLFPPVRPRGHLELRMIDAQQADNWIVPLAVTAGLFSDEEASRAAAEAVAPLARSGDPGTAAACCGPSDPEVARASRMCFSAAIDALARSDTPSAIRDAVGEYNERYVRKDRCPADDLLEEFT
jgi:glutamate--cysteine ligase